MIKIVATTIVVYGLIASIAAQYFYGQNYAVSVSLGSSLMLINVAGLGFIWRQIFAKKSIALAVLVIIFKYVILGMILWSLASVSWLKLTGFLVGIASLIFAILLATLLKSFSSKDF